MPLSPPPGQPGPGPGSTGGCEIKAGGHPTTRLYVAPQSPTLDNNQSDKFDVAYIVPQVNTIFKSRCNLPQISQEVGIQRETQEPRRVAWLTPGLSLTQETLASVLRR